MTSATIRDWLLDNRIFAVSIGVVLGVFGLDIALPLGVAGGITYVVPVAMGLWFKRPKQIWSVMGLSIALVLAGYLVSPDGGVGWVVIVNRSLSILAIIAVGSGIIIYKAQNQTSGQENVATPPLEGKPLRARSVVGIFSVLLIVISSTFYMIAETEEAFDRIAHTHEVEKQLSTILSTMQDLETGQRGYLLTGRDAYLQPFVRATLTVENDLSTLEDLITDNPSQVTRLRALRPLVNKKIDELGQTIEIRRELGLEEAMKIVDSNVGKYIMDAIRGVIKIMGEEEEGLLRERQEEFTMLRSIVLVGFAFAILLVMTIAMLARKRVATFLRYQAASEAALRQTANRLQESDMRYRHSATLSKTGYYTWDEVAHKGVECSEQCARIFGTTPEEWVNRMSSPSKYFDVIHPDDRDKSKEALQKVGEIHAAIDIEYRIVTGDGDVKFVRNIAEPEYDEEGTYVRSIGTIQDITEIKRKERTLQHALDAAEAGAKAKSEFLASMSHEIRTPMTGVMGLADLLLDRPLDSDDKKLIAKIKTSTNQLLRIINDILDVSKLDAGKMEIENIDYHFPSTVDDAVSLFNDDQLGRSCKNLDFVVNLSDDLAHGVHGDSTRVRQILVNLIGNAVKFTDSGSVTVDGKLVDIDGTEFIRITITDTGIGMEPDTISKLFTDFTQADASISRRFEGTGLGLSICKRLTELMGGQIGVESTPGEGSTFWFTVPYTLATSENLDTGARSGEGKIYSAIRSLHILVVDDNRLNQQLVEMYMTKLGHKTITVENGMEAIEAHKQNNFDLILMDVRMPVMSGPEASEIIRQMDGDKAKVPIIALTADAMEDNKVGYSDAGMDAVVGKPIDLAELVTSMNKIMGETVHVPISNGNSPTKGTVNVSGNAKKEEEVSSAVSDFLKNIGASA